MSHVMPMFLVSDVQSTTSKKLVAAEIEDTNLNPTLDGVTTGT